MPKVVLLGDSITQGLGSKKINFTRHLNQLLGEDYEVVNLACTGTTIHYCDTIMNEIMEIQPQIAVIVYGSVDAQIRPNSKGKVFPLIPGRYKRGGMLYERPFYSSRLHRRALEHIDNGIRRILNHVIRQIDGTEQWVQIEEFKAKYQQIIERLLALNIQIISVSTIYLDEHYFKHSIEQYKIFNEAIKGMASQYNYPYIDVFDILREKVRQSSWNKYYCFDHFHPNSNGYQVVAGLIYEAVRCLGKKQNE